MGKDGLKRYAKWNNNDSTKKMEIHPHLCKDCGKSSCLPIKIVIPSVPDYKIETGEQLLSGICKIAYNYIITKNID